MKILRKIGIVSGAVVGGVIGGGVSMVGKLTRVKFLDELGSDIVDSTICTGDIAGSLASGITDTAVGNFKNDPEQTDAGVRELKNGGKLIADNVIGNVKTLAANGGDVLCGVRDGDGERTLRGLKTLSKAVLIGFITVGAIKVAESGVSRTGARRDRSERENRPRRKLRSNPRFAGRGSARRTLGRFGGGRNIREAAPRIGFGLAKTVFKAAATVFRRIATLAERVSR